MSDISDHNLLNTMKEKKREGLGRKKYRRKGQGDSENITKPFSNRGNKHEAHVCVCTHRISSCVNNGLQLQLILGLFLTNSYSLPTLLF